MHNKIDALSSDDLNFSECDDLIALFCSNFRKLINLQSINKFWLEMSEMKWETEHYTIPMPVMHRMWNFILALQRWKMNALIEIPVDERYIFESMGIDRTGEKIYQTSFALNFTLSSVKKRHQKFPRATKCCVCVSLATTTSRGISFYLENIELHAACTSLYCAELHEVLCTFVTVNKLNCNFGRFSLPNDYIVLAHEHRLPAPHFHFHAIFIQLIHDWDEDAAYLTHQHFIPMHMNALE